MLLPQEDLMEQTYTKWIKGILLGVFVLLAGVCYSCTHEAEGSLLVSGEAAETVSGAENTADGAESRPASDTAAAGKPADDAGKAEETVPATDPPPCYVYVCGAVLHPGVYRLQEGQRIYEAIELAGGFASGAARSWLNLAGKVEDGMKLEVPDEEQAKQWQQSAPSGQPAFSGQTDLSGQTADTGRKKVNLNTATREELMTLKGIGEARAEDIIRFREKQGYFQAIEDIMNVPGIKEAAFEKIKEEITV